MFNPDKTSSKLDNILEELEKREYSIGPLLGEGFTKKCYKVFFNAESGVALERVAKIPAMIKDTDSVGHLIYLSKERDPNTDELNWYTKLDHHNIAKLLDSIKINGQIINFEEYFNAKSLQDIVKPKDTISTPIQSEKDFENIFSQVIDAISYLHNEKKVLHRDIKPSNILVNERGHVKLTDLQNAKRIDDVVDQCFATRGGTAYTAPEILNAVFSKDNVSASIKTDLYALGVSMYFTLTGELPFNYEFILEHKGKPIDIGGFVRTVSLKSSNMPIDEISPRLHQDQLKQALKNVPRKYHKILDCLLSIDSEKRYWDIDQVKKDFDKIKGPKRKLFIKDLLKGLKRGFYTAAAGLGACAFTWMIAHVDFSDGNHKVPDASEMFREVSFLNMRFSDIKTRHNITNSLDLMYAKAKDRYDVLKKGNKDSMSNLEFYLNRMPDLQRHHPKLANSLVRACYAADEDTLSELKKDSSRIGVLFVPLTYVNHFNFLLKRETPIEERSWGELMHTGLTFLKQTIGSNYDSVEEIYADYFCSDKEIFIARKAAGDTIPYFGEMKDGVFKPGYRMFLPKVKRNIIDLAIAFYRNTNNEGELLPKRIISASK